MAESPRHRSDGGKSVLAALHERRTIRTLSDKPLPRQMLANLLWAAWGVNRADGRRTAASASNSQEIDLYAVLPEGAAPPTATFFDSAARPQPLANSYV